MCAKTKTEDSTHLLLFHLLLSFFCLLLAGAFAVETVRELPEGLLGVKAAPRVVDVLQADLWLVAFLVLELCDHASTVSVTLTVLLIQVTAE